MFSSKHANKFEIHRCSYRNFKFKFENFSSTAEFLPKGSLKTLSSCLLFFYHAKLMNQVI